MRATAVSRSSEVLGPGVRPGGAGGDVRDLAWCSLIPATSPDNCCTVAASPATLAESCSMVFSQSVSTAVDPVPRRSALDSSSPTDPEPEEDEEEEVGVSALRDPGVRILYRPWKSGLGSPDSDMSKYQRNPTGNGCKNEKSKVQCQRADMTIPGTLTYDGI